MGALSVIPESFARVAAYEAERQAGEANAAELRRSAGLEAANAVAAGYRGSLAAGLYRSRGTMLQGQQVVAQAASGLDVTSGTAADVQESSRIFSELDALTARNNARAAALGHKEAARRYRSEEAQLRRRLDSGRDDLALQLGASALSAALGLGLKGGL